MVRLYTPDGTRIDDGPPVPTDRGVIERLERCGGVFDYDERLTVRVGRPDGRDAYAVVESETLADAADALRRWRDGPEIAAGEFVDLFDTDETEPTDSLHPVPTRVRVFNGDTGTRHFDNDAAPSPPAWSDEASAKTDYERNLRLFADPEAGTLRCYLNVRRRGPEQVIADVSVDQPTPEPFLAYCARAVTRELQRREWELYDADEQLVFDTLRGATTVERRWPYDDRETRAMQNATPVSLAAPTQRAAMGVVVAVREWTGASSLSVAGGDRDGATGAAAIRVGYTPRVSAVTATGEAGRRLAAIRRERARETVDETLDTLAAAVEGDRLPNVRAAAWLNDALGRDRDTVDDDTADRSDTVDDDTVDDDTVGDDTVDRSDTVDDSDTAGGDATGRRARLSAPDPVRPSHPRLRRHVGRLLPTVSVCLALAAVALATALGSPAGAVAAVTREVSVTGTPVVAEPGGSAPVWQLLVATLVPPALTLAALTRPRAVFARQVAAVRDLVAWLTTPRLPETTASRVAFATAVETLGRRAEATTGDERAADDDTASLDERLAASPLAVTTRPPAESESVVSARTVALVAVAVGATLSSLAVPLAGAFGRADAVVPALSVAAVASLPVSWLAAVVALWRS